MALDRTPDVDGRVAIAAILAPLLEHRRSLAFSGLAAALVTTAAVMLPRTTYDASIQLAVVTNARNLPNLSSLGGIPSLLTGALGGLQSNGLQATPALVLAIMKSGDVMRSVGGSGAGTPVGSIADRIKGRRVRAEKVPEVLASVVDAEIQPETGTLRLTVRLPDSALARHVADLVVEETRQAYVSIVRSQARQQRIGQEARVDSAASQLASAERALAVFEAANRNLTRYSEKTLERQVLERRVQLTQQVYLQAAAEHEAAVARELEVTPVLAVLDAVPSVLPRSRRYLLLKVFLAMIAATLVWGSVVLTREGLSARGSADPDLLRLRRAWAELRWRLGAKGPSQE